jgi:hypothetical protein
MWIRKQDGNMSVIEKEFFIIDTSIYGDESIKLGEYACIKRAKQVMSDLCENLRFGSKVFVMPKE